MANVFTFENGKQICFDRTIYANGKYVFLKDYQLLDEERRAVRDQLTRANNQIDDLKEQIAKLEIKLSNTNKTGDDYYNKCIDLTNQIEKLESELEAKDNESRFDDRENYAKYNQMTSGTYGLLLNKYKGKSRNDVILKFSEFINTLSENGIEVFDEAEGFVIEIKDNSLRNNDEIESLKRQIEKLESIRTRCHKSAMDSFDLGMYEFLHIVTADELKTTKYVNDRTVELPFSPLETANMLINATYKAKIPFLEREVDRNIYDTNDLEQIAKHLLVYCKHHREDE